MKKKLNLSFLKKISRTDVIRAVLIALIIADMVMIFMLSAQTAGESGGVSGGFTEKLLSFIGISRDDMTEEAFMHIEAFIRKAAHFCEYAMLGFLAFLLLSTYTLKYRWGLLISSGFAMIYAISDEIHQAFVPGRGPQISDVLVDTCGGIFGTLAALIVILGFAAAKRRMIKNKTRKKKKAVSKKR